MLDPEFIQAMEDNMKAGIKDGRKEGDWKDRDLAGYYDRIFAIPRHLKRFRETKDPVHLAAISDNAMIVFCLQRDKGF
jgi:hypothetical protein